MDTTEKKPQKQPNQSIQVERILGIILLIPPTIGVILFLLNLVSNDVGNIPSLRNLSNNWTGDYDSDGGGYTSSAPIYLGLMAIAGALLLKGTDKK